MRLPPDAALCILEFKIKEIAKIYRQASMHTSIYLSTIHDFTILSTSQLAAYQLQTVDV